MDWNKRLANVRRRRSVCEADVVQVNAELTAAEKTGLSAVAASLRSEKKRKELNLQELAKLEAELSKACKA